MKTNKIKPFIKVIVAAITITSFSNAFAQQLEEVIVTAQKRAESSQDTPISISAFNADFLKESNIVGVDKLMAFTPGLNGTVGQDAESVITVRGVGTDAFGVGVDNSVGLFIDDVPMGRPTLIGNSFFDLERVEVVKGPQGTLFGRNASAGAISLITNKPNLDESTLEVFAGIGNEGQKVYELIGNLAASDQFGVRLAVRRDERDGTLMNIPNGDELNNRDHSNIRLGITYKPSDTVNAYFAVEQVRIDTKVAYASFENAFSGTTAQNYTPSQDINTQRYLAKITWDLDENLSLTSNTSYLDYDLTAIPVDVDVSETPLLIIQEPQIGDQFVQEFRLNGSAENVDWFVGTSYIQETIESRYQLNFSDFILVQLLLGDFTFCDTSGLTCIDDVEQAHFAETNNTSYAVYGDIAWNINEKLKLTVGARYTNDEKEFKVNQPLPNSIYALLTGDALVKLATDGVIKDKDSWSSIDPRIVLDYQITEDAMLYGSVSSGYKSGGFNSDPQITLGDSTASGVAQKPASFDEEGIMAYEVGIKSQFWNNRARLNAAVFYNDNKDYQVEAGDFVINIQNAANVETSGFELDGTFLLSDALTLRATYSYLDATFKDGKIEGVDVSGRSLNRAPENSGSISASYITPLGDLGDLSLRADYIYTDSFLFDSVNLALNQESYGLVNARVGFESASGAWSLALVGENLADEEYVIARSDVLGQNLVVPGMGAIYRFEGRFKF